MLFVSLMFWQGSPSAGGRPHAHICSFLCCGLSPLRALRQPRRTCLQGRHHHSAIPATAITCGRCPEPPPALRKYSEIRFHQNSRSSLRVHARWWGGPAGRSGSAGSSKRRTSKEQTRFTTTDTCTVATLGNGQSDHQNPASGLDSSKSNFRNSWERPPEKLPDMQSRSHAKIQCSPPEPAGSTAGSTAGGTPGSTHRYHAPEAPPEAPPGARAGSTAGNTAGSTRRHHNPASKMDAATGLESSTLLTYSAPGCDPWCYTGCVKQM